MNKLIFLLSCLTFYYSDSQIIETFNGPIRGINKTSALGTMYYSFYKIPYMKPPVGKLRFRDAETPNNWTVTLDCTQEGPRFPQIDNTFDPTGNFDGDLDSMHINVYTNNLNPTVKYPVLVWIHGGGFRSGSSRTDIYGPDYFMEENVVLVTFNYRLYAFGFLSLDDPSLGIPGNSGLKDQVLALKWVKQNIERFGGDSQNVTIFGQSSGGGCSHYHTVSNASRFLFQRSIIMSGSAFNNMYAAIPRRNWALRLSRALNYTGSENETEILQFLEAADPQAMFTAVGTLLTPQEINDERLLNAFGPTIEPYETENSFMLDHPEKLVVNSWGNSVDILIGATSFENGALIPLIRTVPGIINVMANFTSYVPYSLGHSNETREKHGQTLKSTYYGMMEPTITNCDGFITMTNEFAFIHSVHRIVKQRWSLGGEGKSYVYRFDANSDNNCFSQRNRVDPMYTKPIHMDDLCHLFKTSFANVPAVNSIGWNTTKLMVSIVTKFAATGDPGIANWEPSTGDNKLPPLWGFNIREPNSLIGELPESKRMEVWDTFYPTGVSNTVKILNLLLAISLLIVLNT